MSTVITPPCILNFPRLFKPKAVGQGSEPDYGMVALFTEPTLKTQEWDNIRVSVSQVLNDKFGSKMQDPNFLAGVKANLPVKDADEKQGKWNGFEPGRKFITMKRKAEFDRPQLVDRSGNEIIDESLLFAGCIVRCGVRFYAWEHSGRQGASCTVDMVQLLVGGKDVKRLDNKPDAKAVFQGSQVPTDSMNEVLRDMGVDPAQVASENTTAAIGSDLI